MEFVWIRDYFVEILQRKAEDDSVHECFMRDNAMEMWK
jgi:hypothetical protein